MHRDRQHDRKGWKLAWWGIGLTFFAILVAGVIFQIQERSPELSAEFNLRQEGDPRSLECIITNSGRAAAKQIEKINIHTEKELDCQDRINKLTSVRRKELGPILDEFTQVELPYRYVITTRGEGIQVVFPALSAVSFAVHLPEGIPDKFGKYFDEFMQDFMSNNPSLKGGALR
jgi:hypothetical protein